MLTFKQWVYREYSRSWDEILQEYIDDGISKEDIQEEYEAIYSYYQHYLKGMNSR